ncbi:MAG: Fic family protein, partial [Candidatus Cryptobacteroides sp.]
ASADVPKEMALFLDWVNNENNTDPVLKAAVAHLWFVAIHPFDDGNGRLTRTITDMLLARADGMPHRYYSMSAEILRNKHGYYDALEKTTVGDVDITLWLEWFLQTLKSAMERSLSVVGRVVKKTMFWQAHRDVAMNERQVKVVNRLWDGFYGKLTSVKWAKICKTSQATALRDINDLIEKGILVKGEEGSKNTNYILAVD